MKYTREALHTIYQEGLRDKEKEVDDYVGSIVKEVIYVNSRGGKNILDKSGKKIRKFWKKLLVN